MPRQVEKTDRIIQLLRRATQDPEFNVEDVAIYEARSFNTRPVMKRGTLWEGAVHSQEMLREMASLFDRGETVPLLAQHRSGLPLGQVFHAEAVRANDGHVDLNALFFLPKTDNDLIQRLDANVVKEVSVGVRPKALLCNKCGFDFMSENSTWEHLYERTCDNGHTVAKDGTHLIAQGLDKWFELSLVDRGAAQGTAILPRSQQIAANGNKLVGLAACDAGDRRPYLIASFAGSETTPQNTGEKKSVDELIELKAELKVASRDLEAATSKAQALEAENASLKTKLAASEATDAAKMKPQFDAAVAFLSEQAKASLAALGKTADTVPDTVEGLVETIRTARNQLAAVIPIGGASRATEDDADAPETTAHFNAFKTR